MCGYDGSWYDPKLGPKVNPKATEVTGGLDETSVDWIKTIHAHAIHCC